MLMLLLKGLNRIGESVLLLHSGKNILTVKQVPRRGNDSRALVMLAKKLYALGNLLVLCALCMREYDSRSVLDLVVIELTEVLHIHFALINVGNCGKAVEDCSVLLGGFGGADNVGELTYARGLDNNSVGGILLKHLYKRLRKIADKRAADTAGVHLGDLNAGIGKEAAVNTDLTELVLNKNDLLACVGLFNKLLNKRGLARAEEAGKYIYLCHYFSP